jgi:hypothetical protein
MRSTSRSRGRRAAGVGTRTVRRLAACAAVLAFFAAVPAAGRAASVPLTSKPLAAYRTCVLTASTATSAAAFDSFVAQGTPTTNNGTTATMSVQNGNATNTRAYVRFDLSQCHPAIASSATVRTATLRLFMSTLPAACRTHDVFRVTATWTEAGITWNNQPFGTTINNPPTAQRTSSAAVGSAPCTNSTNNAYVAWDVTADAQAFVAGTATNFGWMVRDDAEGTTPPRQGQYAARNAGVYAAGPQLVIGYST